MSQTNNTAADLITDIRAEVKKLRENLALVQGGSMSAKA